MTAIPAPLLARSVPDDLLFGVGGIAFFGRRARRGPVGLLDRIARAGSILTGRGRSAGEAR